MTSNALIAALCARDPIHLRREVPVQDAEGQGNKTWTAAARGALPADDQTCQAQELPPVDVVALGVSGTVRMWSLWFSINPFLDTRDHVFFTPLGETAQIEAEVFSASRNTAGKGRIFKSIVRLFGPGR